MSMIYYDRFSLIGMTNLILFCHVAVLQHHSGMVMGQKKVRTFLKCDNKAISLRLAKPIEQSWANERYKSLNTRSVLA